MPHRAAGGTAGLLLAALMLAGAVPASAQDDRDPTLDVSGLDIDQLARVKITSVSRKPQSIAQATAAVSVITRDDIRRAGATSVPEALRLVPGLQVARVDSRDWAISSRGFNDLYSNKLLVMVDGRTIYSPAFAGVFWDVQEILLDNVDRIEVIRGPGATLWGANAVNGVINIITRPASESVGGRAGVLLGTGPHLRGVVRYGARLGGRGAVRAYATASRRAITELAGGAESHDTWRIGQGGFRADWAGGTRDRFMLQGDAYVARGDQRLIAPTLEPPYTELRADDLDANGFSLLGEWRRQMGAESELMVTSYVDRAVRRQPGFFGELTVSVFDIDIQHGFLLAGVHDVLWGVGARRTTDDNAGDFAVSFDPPSRSTLLLTGFLQDEIVLVPGRVALTLGSKVEHNDFTGVEVQPNLRALWTPTLSSTVWAAASRAVRTPSRLDSDLRENVMVVPGPPVTVGRILGSEAFESERVMAWEAGYRAVPHAAVSFDVALFYNRYAGLRTLTQQPTETGPGPAVVPFRLGNGALGRTFGAELATSVRATPWWRLRGHYTWLDMDVEVAADAPPGTFADGTPGLNARHRAGLSSFFSLPRGIELDVTARYVSGLTGLGIPVPDYLTGDARLALQLGPLSVSLVGQDLLAPRHAEFPAPPFAAEQREIVRRGSLRIATAF